MESKFVLKEVSVVSRIFIFFPFCIKRYDVSLGEGTSLTENSIISNPTEELLVEGLDAPAKIPILPLEFSPRIIISVRKWLFVSPIVAPSVLLPKCSPQL